MKRSRRKDTTSAVATRTAEATAYRGLLGFLNRHASEVHFRESGVGDPIPVSKSDAQWGAALRGIAFVTNGMTWVKVPALRAHERPIAASDLGFWGADGARHGRPGLFYSEEPPWDARPREDIKEKIRKLLQWLKGLGLDTGSLEEWLKDIEFHEAGKDTAVNPEDGDAEAVTLMPKLGPFAIIPWDSGLIIVFDGNTHIVLKPKTVTALMGDQFDRQCHLTSAAETVLHELLHVLIARTGCCEDDDADMNVTTLERALSAWVHWRKVRQANGDNSDEAKRARRWVDHWINEVRQRGASGCLQNLGVS